MSYARKNSAALFGLIVLMISFVATSAWQFYKYVTFRDAEGFLSSQGGTLHLTLAIALALLACGIGFLVSSVFLRHDTEDDLHITSPPHPAHSISQK